ncbi:hypothetical protein BBP00_00002803 [Phytophthora kernoviae]|uniref:LysM domain-containing protein n=1 Tax=Phytophthora kernoviae TaxID=325452 RepID=A0A3F2RXY2_9STRA|nr:hypothetical protein BBP00_00002803 [Phytophthora kernoviae]
MDDGGKPIQDYELTFTEAIIKVDRVDEKGLLSGAEHLEFQVRAVNTNGIPGDYGDMIKSISTIAPRNEFKLLDELQAAVNSRSRTVDSLFLSGFMQRYDKHHYIEQVSCFIISMHPELEERVNEIVSRTQAEFETNEDSADQGFESQSFQQTSSQRKFDDLPHEEKVAERRRQFHFRIAELRNDLKKAEYNVQWCKDRRIDLVALIRAAETRILEKQAELERARMFKGPQMDSDVLGNGLQRFFTKQLVVALEDEIEIDQLYILDSKAEGVKTENYLRADIKCRDTLLKRLKDRETALEDFESNPAYRALLSFEAVGDVQGELACYRGLQRVYEKLDDKEMVEINKHQADEIEFVLAKKLMSAGQMIDKLQQRLVGAGAESSCEITLERVGPIVPRLRRERIQRKLDIQEEMKLVASLEKLLEEKKTLLAKGEDDLKRALASDSSEVDSAIIIGSNARYDIEDFKKKLAKLIGSVKAGGEQIHRDIINAKIRISNAEDEIKGHEEELTVETGALMRKVMSKERIRCFRFNATNEALKNVVGTASHGITTCFASAGLNGFLFDILTGACLAQAVGDPLKNHLGEPTGHQAQILCVHYVGHRIYTGSVNASLGAGETLRSLSLMYRTSIQKLLQWNSIADSTKIYLGQKLIVEIDANVSASDELMALDLASSVSFGKLSYENLDFVAASRAKSKDVESQWTAQRVTMVAKEYFPDLNDEEGSAKAIGMGEAATEKDNEADSDADNDQDSNTEVEYESENDTTEKE